MEKKILGRKKRLLLFTLLHITAAFMALGIGIIISNAWVSVESQNSDNMYSYLLEPWDIRDQYEDTILFEDILKSGISDITRMTVIRSQMETNQQYDSTKPIDVIAYANRKNTAMKHPLEGKIFYLLEDLIKWGNYGYEWMEVEVPEENPDAYFYLQSLESEENSETTFEPEVSAEDAEEEDIMPESAVVEEAAETSVQIATEYEGDLTITQELLVERYQTLDGGNLVDYASDWENYEALTMMLRNTCEELSSNYGEYKSFKNAYEENETNIRYCYEMDVDGRKEYITNFDIKLNSPEEYNKYFQDNFGKYLYYSAENMEFETNIDISQQQMQYYTQTYDYAYQEDTRIWIGVDTTYPITDVFKEGLVKYNNFMPYYWMISIFVIAMAVLYIALLVVLTIFEGRERAYALKAVDRIPVEVMYLFAAMGTLPIAFGISLVYQYGYLATNNGSYDWLPIAMGMIAFVISVYIVAFYMTLARRLKGHAFWKTTIIGIFFGWLKRKIVYLIRKVKTFLIKLYNNADLVVRVALPFSIFVVMNGLLTLSLGLFGALVALLIDVAVCIFLMMEAKSRQDIVVGIETIRDGNLEYQVETKGMIGDNLVLANSVNSIGVGIRSAVEKSMKDERLKADLITNVSHDIKTPLTSIINYVDLIKRENIQDEKISGYIEVLDAKSQRLKQLTEDLVEASKISSGNISFQMERINFVELIYQTIGEFSEKFDEKQLNIVVRLPEHPVHIEADSRRIWRIIENIYNNIYKYALPGTRVYLDMLLVENTSPIHVELSVKNISAQPLNINADELTERFIRGDVSRSTEGSGLGLSIAKNLTEAQKGRFTVYLDGDLFKVILDFPILEESTIIK